MSWKGGCSTKVPHGVGVGLQDVLQQILAEACLE
jgi:hypothetical protein